ncbi:ABC transporter permease [Archaeoglobus veneficus]|uniref:ABC-2 type transporter transmembrane domain-containing protein n=1 Tax=Archaeoglobus veneficus (strain DSM 11195 / SNP6) TaxID=693661 RepID=F2KSP5_ARCVS|nr:ABC transporter permease [Archaeoglobus veneficus]AEA48115.1 hypothetical protein Arcve_2126 [Archaeoglobus veneficus SNP6]
MLNLRIVELAAKDLKSVGREKTFLMAVGLQLFVAMFASVLTFGLLVLYNPSYAGIGGDVEIGLVGDAPVLESVLNAIKYDSIQQALEDFYSGKIDAVVWLPKENLSSTNFVRVYLPKEEVKAIQASIVLREKLVEYEEKLRELRGVPGEVNLKIYSPEFESVEVPEGSSVPFKLIYVVLIPLLMLTTAATAAGMFIDLITEEIESKTAHVLLATPLTPIEFIAGKVLAAIVLSAILAPTWMLLLILNGVEIHSFALVALLSVAVSCIFISIAGIASLAGDRERAQLIFSLLVIGLIPVFFISHLTPAGLVTRIAAGSPFEVYAVVVYLTAPVLLVYVSSRLIADRLFRE